jgi:hypothetical protein
MTLVRILAVSVIRMIHLDISANSICPIAVVTSGIATQVNLSDADCARWDELEFLAHAVRFECGKCLKTLSVDRRQLVKEKSKKRIHCTTPSCTQVWCRNCQSSLDPSEKQKHVCEGKKELKRLLKKEGWRQCPGIYSFVILWSISTQVIIRLQYPRPEKFGL